MLKQSAARYISAIKSACITGGEKLTCNIKKSFNFAKTFANTFINKVDKTEAKRFALTCVAPMLCISLITGGIACAFTQEPESANNTADPAVFTEVSIAAPLEQVATVQKYDVPMNKRSLTMAYGFYADGELLGAMIDSDELTELTESILAEVEVGTGDKTVAEYANATSLQVGLYSNADICTASELKEIILKSDAAAIKITKTTTDYNQIDFKTIESYDNTMAEGDTKVTQKGVKGVEMVISSVTTVNGKVTETKVLNKAVTREPVDEHVNVGTRSIAGVASGSFAWPCAYTYSVSSGFGYRWGVMHQGIDITDSGVYGAGIQASDGGTVITVRYDSYGYGYHIEIDHGNGYVTRYAHCSDIYVTEGEQVKKGETIGAVGSTGDSTGAHLHFEIIENGIQVDPENYLY